MDFMMNKRLISTIVLVFGVVATAQALPVFNQTTIIGDSSIFNEGTLVVANNLGVLPTAVTVNGVTFGADQGGLSSNWSDGFSYADFSTDAFSEPLDTLMSNLKFVNNNNPATLNIDALNIGQSYMLQLIFSNDVNFAGNDVDIDVSFGGGTFNLVNWQDGAVSVAVSFIATDTMMTTTFGGNADFPLDRAVLNAYSLHQVTVPEPGTIILILTGLVCLGLTRRKSTI
ncbi:MAG: hypothetical protein ACJAYG_001716 [Oceanicoccus sp.]|jgi:hypothetical protein